MSGETKCVVIGLIGGICAGKSTISKILQEKGAQVVDADKMGHLAYAKGTECQRALVEHFGEQVLDASSGEINRRALGGIVFADPAQMTALNGLVWPALRSLLEREISEQRRLAEDTEGTRVVVLEAAVLLEAGWTDLVDEVWAVEVERETSVQRLMARNSLEEQQARQRVEAQLTNQERRAAAQRVFDNNPTGDAEGGGVSGRLREEVTSALQSVLATSG
mmetsp:Transcript_9316/g.17371  ORF Transcript_9316/g.17371 Transcript_9316/m.17371 type:complete len:221 (+) Transcript_9316:72-734(+)